MLLSTRAPVALLRPSAAQSIRLVSSGPSPVKLAYESQLPVAGQSSSKAPLVVLHGLYGSKQNWRSLAKGMASKLGREVFTLVRKLSLSSTL